MSEANVQMLVGPDGDDWPLARYKEVYAGLRATRSLREVKETLESNESKANWGRFETRDRINLAMKNDLRRYAGAPEILTSAAEAVAQYAAPKVTVWFVGDTSDKADRIVMIDPEATIGIRDGTITIGGDPTQRPENGNVQGCTPAKRRRLDTERYKAFNERRKAIGVSWIEIHEAGLAVLEAAARLEGA